MAQLKQCDRCKKVIENPNEIGVVLEVSRYRLKSGYIRPEGSLLKGIQEEKKEYLPIEFRDYHVRDIDLCTDCSGKFMEIK